MAEDLIGHSCRPLAPLGSPRSGGAFFLNAPPWRNSTSTNVESGTAAPVNGD